MTKRSAHDIISPIVSMKEAQGLTSCFLHGFFCFGRMNTMQKKNALYRMIITAVLLALGLVLPFLTGQLQSFGQMLRYAKNGFPI